MKRRTFLLNSAGLTGVFLPVLGSAQSKPCPPSPVSAAGGSTVSTLCPAGSAEADWLSRSTAPGVVAAYDFSKPPANGGDWKWGSLAPGITCMSWKESVYSGVRTLDTAIYPPGSTASLRWSLPQGTGERSDSWLISIDQYAQQFGEGDEFYIQWRQRMDSTYATFAFRNTSGGITTFKHIIISEGMQDPMPYSTTRAYYGYEGPGTNSDNTINDVRFCSENQLVMIARNNVSNSIKYPQMYHGCGFYQGFTTYANSVYTDRNEGNQSAATKCIYNGSGEHSNPATCFSYLPETWMTFMIRVICGPQGTATSSLGGGTQSGFINSTVEYYGAYEGESAFSLLHRKTGIVLRRGNSSPTPGWSPTQKFGVFGWMTFMTLKDDAQAHPTANTWVSQVIISRKAIPVPGI